MRDEADTTLVPEDPERTGAAAAGEPAQSGLLGVVVRGRYEVRGRVAAGGGGRIMAVFDRQLGREVAIKELHDGADGAASARFVREALLTASLQHPNIVPVYDAGRWPSGEPFFAMKLVDGRPLSAVIAEATTLEARLALLPHVLGCAEGVAFAHAQGVIHRDLKPANVLVGRFGETVVIDWGLAKRIDERAELREAGASATPSDPRVAELSAAGSVLGTPAYMAPEQARGNDTDARADVYALGAMLDHLLSGAPPYGGGAWMEVLGMVLVGPPAPLRERAPGAPEELVAIVAKAMDRDRERRYRDAAAFAADLRNFQTGRIVGAHRYSWSQHVSRFVRRHRVAVAVTAAALVSLATVGSWGLVRIVDERNAARAAEQTAAASRDQAERDRAEAERARDQAEDHADGILLEQARGAAERNPALAITRLDQLGPRFARWGAAQVIAENARAHGLPLYLRRCDGARGCTPVRLGQVAFDEQGARLLATTREGEVAWFDGATGVLERVVPGLADVDAAVALPDGGLAIAQGPVISLVAPGGTAVELARHDGDVVVLAVATGPRVLALSQRDALGVWSLDGTAAPPIACVRPSAAGRAPVLVSGDGRRVLTLSLEGLRLDELDTGVQHHLPVDGLAPHVLALDHGGARVAFAGNDGQRAVWDVASDRRIAVPAGLGAVSVAGLSGDGRVLVAGSFDGSLRALTLDDGAMRLVDVHEAMVTDLAIDDEGRVVSAAGDGELRINRLDGSDRRVVGGQGGTAADVSLGAPGRAVIGTVGGHHWLWSERTGEQRVVMREPVGLTAMVADAEGTPWVGTGGGELVAVDLDRGAGMRVRVGTTAIQRIAVGRDVVAGGDETGMVAAFDRRGGVVVPPLDVGNGVRALALSPDGRWLAAGGGGQLGATLFALREGDERRELGGLSRPLSTLAWLPDGRLAMAPFDRELVLFATDFTPQQRWREHDDEIWHVAASHDGRWLASIGRDNRLVIYDLATGTATRHSPTAGAFTLRFTADDTALVLDGRDLVLRRFELASATVTQHYVGHGSFVTDAALVAGSPRMVSSAVDGTLRIWNLADGENRVLRGHQAGVSAVLAVPSRGEVVSASHDGTLRAWRDALPADREGLRAWLRETRAVVDVQPK
ncbi:MAG: protein kinase [Nannocystaceae bacterium]|nr:protein kinase [Nannocystaceae bacterium]